MYVCFWNLAQQNITGDENTYVVAGWQYLHGDFGGNREHPPTAKYLYGLAQLIGGQGVLAPRVLVGAMMFGLAVIIYFWVRREVGWWAGVTGAAWWLLTPRGNAGDRIDRLALLEPVMMFFAVAALYAAWVAVKRGRMWLTVLSGVLMAASVTSKVSTVVLVPAVVVLFFLFDRWKRALVRAIVWGIVFVAVGVLLYLPMGIRSAVTYMIQFQAGQNAVGHEIEIAGRIFWFAPWWANGWFMAEGMGIILVVVLALGAILALGIKPDRFVLYIAGSLGLLVVFYTVAAKISLPDYYYAWAPLLIILAATGYGRLALLQPTKLFATIATVAVLMTAIPAVQLSVSIWNSRPTGIARVSTMLAEHHLKHGKVLALGMSTGVIMPYFDTRVTVDPSAGPFVAVLIGSDSRMPVDASMKKLLASERSEFQVVHLDDITAWIPRDSQRVVHGTNGFALVSGMTSHSG